MSSIFPLPVRSAPNGLDVAPLAFAVERMAPGLWAPILRGESFDEALIRREAARDILDELLAEYAEYAGAVSS